ncbi:MAG TPA: cupin domain-containing protein [Acidobacteriaceae bacterium]|nr:cupin domain-containing protein [Acidobacteriaceae bacterium]
MSEPTIYRKELLKAVLENHAVTSVDVREIRFQPDQRTGRHLHPCPVFGYIAEGSAILEVEGEPPQHLPAGSAFHEPAGKVIARFDNASATAPLTFIAYYLLHGQQELIAMLPDAS